MKGKDLEEGQQDGGDKQDDYWKGGYHLAENTARQADVEAA